MNIHPLAIVLGYVIGSVLALLMIWLFPILSRTISALRRDSAPTRIGTAMDGASATDTGPTESPIP